MFLIYGSEQSWTPEEWTQCTVDSSAICLELAAKGQFVAAAPLHPVSTATSLRVRDGKRLITDGPFAETTEQLGGYYIVDVANLDEAIAIASRLPPAKKGTVEIRPVYELPAIPIPDDCEIMSSRDFAFSREQVFRAFSNPDRLARWWGPKGFRNTFHIFHFQPGGEWQFVMHGPDGTNYDNRCVFESIVDPERIVIDHVSAPRFTLTISLVELPGEETRVIWLQRFESAAMRTNIAKFAVDANEQNFDRLTDELASSAIHS
jgi:hypothetical protein